MLLALAFAAQDAPIRFERVQLSSEFLCEGANIADLDNDGDEDIVAGPIWYEGPDFAIRHEIWESKTFDPHGYSDSFFVWPEDMDGDGWPDLFVVGFPGKEAYWYRNPLAFPEGNDTPWERFLVRPSIDNESPAFVDLVPGGRPELVHQEGGRFGWSDCNVRRVRETWVFHPISEALDAGAFTHGLGVGDLDGDGRMDVLWKEGWYRQPESLQGDPLWVFHPFRFSDREGGAQMLVSDLDGDGDGDVISSLAAHHFGLSWFENTKVDGKIVFVEHRVMDELPSKSPHGVCFAELHALELADVDGDKLPDVVTGKRWWSHGPDGDPQPGSRPEVWWFQLVRRPDGAVDLVPHLADDASGVGVSVVTGDVDLDGRRDVVVANKLGTFVLYQRRGGPNLDFEGGDLAGWTATGDAFEGQPVRGDTVAARGREPSRHQGATDPRLPAGRASRERS